MDLEGIEPVEGETTEGEGIGGGMEGEGMEGVADENTADEKIADDKMADEKSEADVRLEESLREAEEAEERAADIKVSGRPVRAAGGPMETTVEHVEYAAEMPASVLAGTVRIKLWKYDFELEKKIFLFLIANASLASSIIFMNFLLFKDMVSLFSSINIIAVFIFAFPVVMIRYSIYKRYKEIEELFPVFLRDFVQAVRGGMTVPHAIKAVARNDYKALSPHVKKMAIQIDWGIPIEKVLVNFSKRVRSKLITRIVSSVRESHRFGGNLADTFEALSNTAVEVERLREERRLYLHSQMITGYIIFFVFLAVIIALEKFLVPSFKEASATALIGAGVTGETSAVSQEELVAEYKTIFQNLILIQGFFAGLAVGKMAEGAMVAGLKHSMIMMFVGVLVFSFVA